MGSIRNDVMRRMASKYPGSVRTRPTTEFYDRLVEQGYCEKVGEREYRASPEQYRRYLHLSEQPKWWTPEEDKTLEELAGKVPASVIAEQLGRTKKAVHARIKRRKLSGYLTGEHHWNARVTALQASMIACLADGGYTLNEIHRMFEEPPQISRNTVNDIIAGRTWKRGFHARTTPK